MGLELVEVIIRIEDELAVAVHPDAWDSLTQARERYDVTAGELLDMICSGRMTRVCVTCRYDLRGHSEIGRCPECGNAFAFAPRDADDTWPVLRRILSDVLGIKREEITRDSWLVRDLGLT
jgi:acyl carrier protein